MELTKHLEFFNPTKLNAPVHIIGVGAMGSRVLELLVRLGVENIYIYDFDKVEEKNVTNQYYTHKYVGQQKVDAIKQMMDEINPQAIKRVYQNGYSNQALSGYVFLCVDSIELRHKIAKDNEYNPNIKAMFDTRMRLTDAQSYACDWSNEEHKKKFIGTMEFSDEEAKEATPVSACGTTLSVAPTVVTTAAATVSNMINFANGKPLQNIILLDAFKYNYTTIEY